VACTIRMTSMARLRYPGRGPCGKRDASAYYPRALKPALSWASGVLHAALVSAATAASAFTFPGRLQNFPARMVHGEGMGCVNFNLIPPDNPARRVSVTAGRPSASRIQGSLTRTAKVATHKI
jgi:hypothetical protein